MPIWEPTAGSRGPTYAGGPSWHEKWQPQGGYYGPAQGEPYDHWLHIWHLHPGLRSEGQFRTTAPVVESALLARPWEVPELRYIAEQGPEGWRSAYEGVSELTTEPWQVEVDGNGHLKCLACCAAQSGFCGAPGPGHGNPSQKERLAFASGKRDQGLGRRPVEPSRHDQYRDAYGFSREGEDQYGGRRAAPAPRRKGLYDDEIDPRVLNRLEGSEGLYALPPSHPQHQPPPQPQQKDLRRRSARPEEEDVDPRVLNRFDAPTSRYVLPPNSVARPADYEARPDVLPPATYLGTSSVGAYLQREKQEVWSPPKRAADPRAPKPGEDLDPRVLNRMDAPSSRYVLPPDNAQRPRGYKSQPDVLPPATYVSAVAEQYGTLEREQGGAPAYAYTPYDYTSTQQQREKPRHWPAAHPSQ